MKEVFYLFFAPVKIDTAAATVVIQLDMHRIWPIPSSSNIIFVLKRISFVNYRYVN